MGANNNDPGGARLLAAADAGDLGAELAPSVEARNGGPIGASSLMVAHDSGLGGARPRSGGPNRARPLPEAAVGDLRAELAQPMEVHSGGDLEHGGGYYGMVDGLECGGGLRCDDGLERSGICDPDDVEMLDEGIWMKELVLKRCGWSWTSDSSRKVFCYPWRPSLTREPAGLDPSSTAMCGGDRPQVQLRGTNPMEATWKTTNSTRN